MNERDPEIGQTAETQGTAPWTPAGQPDPLRRGAYTVETEGVGTDAVGTRTFETEAMGTDAVERDGVGTQVLERHAVEQDSVRTTGGNFAEGEEALPEADALDRVIHRGSFASGGEEMPEENAERRIHARGGFAVGEETTPDEDAEARSHPGTFADSQPPA